jgi:DnaJ-class molecular chaperone
MDSNKHITYKNACRTLNLPLDHTKDQLKQQYRLLVKQFHPDRNPNPEANEQFRQIHDSYEFLLKRDVAINDSEDNQTDQENLHETLRNLIRQATNQYSVFPASDIFFENLDYELLVNKLQNGEVDSVTEYLGDRVYEHISQQLSNRGVLGNMFQGLFGILFG